LPPRNCPTCWPSCAASTTRLRRFPIPPTSSPGNGDIPHFVVTNGDAPRGASLHFWRPQKIMQKVRRLHEYRSSRRTYWNVFTVDCAEVRARNLTVTHSPPPDDSSNVTAAPRESATALTMASPSPLPDCT